VHVALLAVLALSACVTPATDPVLNSDRIRQKFGNYGVDVLFSSDQQRISSLYSKTPHEKVTRTFAVVDFSSPVPAALANEHQRVASGQSIGETFREAGWQIEKHNIYIGELEVPDTNARIALLMDIVLPRLLAAHAYFFVVKKDEQTNTYATILEIHHPEYLSVGELEALYGTMLFDDSNRVSFEDFVDLPDEFNNAY
jgi:hypothetical protein